MKIFNKILNTINHSAVTPIQTNKSIENDISKIGDTSNIGTSKIADICPYCLSKKFVKRGTRKNKNQIVQLYLCKNIAELLPPKILKENIFLLILLLNQ